MKACSQATHSSDGVDLTLIRWFLSLSPAERLEALESFANDILELRNGGVSTGKDAGDPEKATG
jgi:hypothetical protein